MDELKHIEDRPALSGWPMIIFYLAMLIFASHACTRMVAAGDTWVAMACGRHFLNHGVDTVEPFSANSHEAGPTEKTMRLYARQLRRSVYMDSGIKAGIVSWWAGKAENFGQWPGWFKDFAKWIHPTGWVNQNWLTHVIFYWVTHESPIADADTFSYNTLVYWKFAIYIITVICVYQIGRALGVNPALSAVFAAFALFVGRTFLDVRPAGFSNMLVAVYLLILVLATYRNILCIWLIVPLVVFWCNVHGGYIYAFVMLVPFVLLHLLTVRSRRWFVSVGFRGVLHAVGAGFAALVAMIIFNPFHLTNLTHTFVISVSKYAEGWRMVHEWHPAFKWDNPVGDEIPFLVMFIIALGLLALWAVVLLIRPRIQEKRLRRRKEPDPNEYQWPQIDLALLAIAALTVYMAIRSRRFIPVAAIAACPVMAMFIDQAARMLSARRSFLKNGSLTVGSVPQVLQKVFIAGGAAAVLFFGLWWGCKFKRIYLDPSSKDAKLNSVFMRMTASDAKPFYACRFIKENKLKGKMFNYWTEGGFIAYGQEPDPATGKTALQLFMDGRAQAAYDYGAFELWKYIYRGGEIPYKVHLARRSATSSELVEIGKWIDKQLKKHEVWIVLLPRVELAGYFARGLTRHPHWVPVFLNDKQKLLADVSTARGKALYEGVISGRSKFPDEVDRLLMLAFYGLESRESPPRMRLRAFEYAKKSFEMNPSRVAFLEIASAGRYPYLSKKVIAYCKDYLNDFEQNKRTYAKQDGYGIKMGAARVAADYLSSANRKNNKELAAFYARKSKDYRAEEIGLSKHIRW